nr:hypothetical protein [Tanacetum cinerariifolium]
MMSEDSSQVNEVHSDDNHIFDNVNHQLAQEMHQEEHLGFDDEYDFLTNTIPYKKLSLVRQEQCLVIHHNQRNAEHLKENELLKSTLSAKDKSIEFLKSEKEKVLTDKKELVDSYLDDIICLRKNELLKSTLSAKDKSIEFLKSEKEKVLTDKKELVDSYLDDIVSLRSANRVTKEMLQRFNMPTHTIPMLSKKPRRATADLHQDILGTRNPRLGYLAKRTQPVLYDDNTLLDPTHTPVSVWDCDDVLVYQVVSMHKMKDKPGHVRPESGFYAKLNAIKFVPQTELSREQAYWLNSQDHTPSKPITPFVRNGPPPSQVLASLHLVKVVFPQFESIIIERTTKKPLYISVACFDYAKEFAEQQLTPFYEHFKKHIEAVDATIRKEVAKYKQIFNDLEAEEHSKVLELEAKVLKRQHMLTESEKRYAFLENEHVNLQLKECLQSQKRCNSSNYTASNAIFEINKLKDQLQGKDEMIRNLQAQHDILFSSAAFFFLAAGNQGKLGYE